MGAAKLIRGAWPGEPGRTDAPVHRLDARAKTVVTLAFIVTVMSFPRREISALTPFVIYPVALVAAGRVPARPLLARLLAAAPFVVAVGICNPLLDRRPVAAVGPLVLTGGWLSFISLMLRFALTAGAALALVACTGMYRLGAGLRQLGVPGVLVAQLLFLHRYLFLVEDQGRRMLRSAELRAGGRRVLRFRVCGALAGSLLLRSLDRAGRIRQAMLARGFDGEFRLLHRGRCRPRDVVFIVVCLSFFGIARAWNLARGLGLLLAGAWT
jgi:cobalt/nickel transport system permease protein